MKLARLATGRARTVSEMISKSLLIYRGSRMRGTLIAAATVAVLAGCSTYDSVTQRIAQSITPYRISYHDLATLDVSEQGGRPLINLFRAQPRALPIEISMMERHPLGSQAFVPLAQVSYVVVVAPAGEFDPARMRAFWTEGWQGVNYAKGVWHHPLLALERISDFVVVDRGGDQRNCDELMLPDIWQLAREPSLEPAS